MGNEWKTKGKEAYCVGEFEFWGRIPYLRHHGMALGMQVIIRFCPIIEEAMEGNRKLFNAGVRLRDDSMYTLHKSNII